MAVAQSSHPHPALQRAIQAHVQGQAERAEELYRQVLRETPDPQAAQFLGVLLFQADRRSEGLEWMERATKLAPADGEAWSNLGNALRVVGRHEEAITCLVSATTLRPDLAAAHCNLSACYRRAGTLSRSISEAKEALRIEPNMAQALCNLGLALLERGDALEAVKTLGRAIQIAPQFSDAIQSYLFALHYSDKHDARTIAQEAARLGARFGSVPVRRTNPKPRSVGFLSGDFRKHPVATFLEPLLRHRDRARYRFVALSNAEQTDSVTDRLRGLFDEWIDVFGVSADKVAERSRQAELDIVVDLSGHTAGNRADALAKGLAPVQVSWLGYSGTSGLPALQALIADPIVVTDAEDCAYSERLALLPGSVFCWDIADLPAGSASPPCASSGCVTFGSFNNLSKLSPKTVVLWTEVLGRVPGSRLLLKSTHLAEPEIAAHVRSRFVEAGLDQDRLETVGWLPGDGHQGAYDRIDVALDPTPYTGATTTCEALAMGVPVVTLRGDRYAGRMSASILTAVGRAEWIADTESRYVELAVELSTDPIALGALRQSLRLEMKRSILCDGPKFARDFEDALERAWSIAGESQ